MRTLEETRRIEVMTSIGWVNAHMGQLDAGDTIRMFNPDGTPVVNNNTGTTEWVVAETPRVVIDEVPVIAVPEEPTLDWLEKLSAESRDGA